MGTNNFLKMQPLEKKESLNLILELKTRESNNFLNSWLGGGSLFIKQIIPKQWCAEICMFKGIYYSCSTPPFSLTYPLEFYDLIG